MEEFKVIIAGGRDFKDLTLLCNTMDALLTRKRLTHKIIVVSGGARGADTIGEQYAKLRGYATIIMKADWDGIGKAAGIVRNGKMLEIANAVVCFWNNKSRGTKHMINITRNKGVPLHICNY